MKPWYIYLLRCADGTLYTGITNRLEQRIDAHQKGKGARYTRTRLPIILVKAFKVGTQSEAMKLERKVKTMKKIQKIQFFENASVLGYEQ